MTSASGPQGSRGGGQQREADRSAAGQTGVKHVHRAPEQASQLRAHLTKRQNETRHTVRTLKTQQTQPVWLQPAACSDNKIHFTATGSGKSRNTERRIRLSVHSTNHLLIMPKCQESGLPRATSRRHISSATRDKTVTSMVPVCCLDRITC